VRQRNKKFKAGDTQSEEKKEYRGHGRAEREVPFRSDRREQRDHDQRPPHGEGAPSRHARGGEWKERNRRDERRDEGEEPASKRPKISSVEPLEGYSDSKLRGGPLPSPLPEDDSPTEVEATYNPAWGPVYVAPPKKQRTKPKLSVTWASDESLEQVRVFVSDLETEVLSYSCFVYGVEQLPTFLNHQLFLCCHRHCSNVCSLHR